MKPLTASGKKALASRRPLGGGLGVPLSTYRLQLNRGFSLRKAIECAGYLSELGITHLYTSPLSAARPGSLHGYDVVDYSRVNPEIGGEGVLRRLVRGLRRRKMGVLLDIVPNHMCVASPENRWWSDVLENGPSSPYAGFFDIDWEPPHADLRQKVLVPVLGAPLGEVLEKREIRISLSDGAFEARYFSSRFPLEPRSWRAILAAAEEALPRRRASSLREVLAELDGLPEYTESRPEKIRERHRRIAGVKERLGALSRRDRGISGAIAASLERLNGGPGKNSAGALGDLLAAQPYRLAFWQEAAGKLNYRRFFDVHELAGLRVEAKEVFSAVHACAFRLIREGCVDGLRVDHIDGLFDPKAYLRDLQRGCRAAARGRGGGRRPFYVVVEKILARDERLRPQWPVGGTTGYEFLNLLNGLFVAPGSGKALRGLYARFTRRAAEFPDVVYESKRQVLRTSLSSEFIRLARLLGRMSGQVPKVRRFAPEDLREALSDLIACFQVYRTYLRGGAASGEDAGRIREAVRSARARGPKRRGPLLAWLGELIRGGGRSAPRLDPRLRREFVMRFQQLTGPAMAKGFEDTVLYRHHPLGSLNEVGGEPDVFGVSPERFHRENRERLRRWPGCLLATSTHDTKRSEDVRARLNALSEIPGEWERAIRRWRGLNRAGKTRVRGAGAPDPNDEYLLYQTLAGAWPCAPMSPAVHREFIGRIQAYMQKALREAKARTSWSRPDHAYEEAVRAFVAAVLERQRGNAFLEDMQEFLARIVRPGIWNSLSQTLLKIASPGVPDFYQGCETLSFRLVDPDNRSPVDFASLKRSLDSLRVRGGEALPALAEALARSPEDGRVKLFVASRALALRRARPEVFAGGRYLPLAGGGRGKDHLIAFARVRGKEAVIAAAGRFFVRLGAAERPPIGEEAWGSGAIALGRGLASGAYRDALTGRLLEARPRLPLAEVFSCLPVAFLERVG